MIREAAYIEKLNDLSNVKDIDYLEVIAYVLRLGVLSSGNLYGFTVNNMLELLDQEPEFIQNLYKKCESIVKKQEKIANTYKDYILITDFLEDFFKECGFCKRDCVSYATICTAFWAWKKELIIMEEYYEIRDMFVPFGLSITEDCMDVNKLYDLFTSKLKSSKQNTFLMLCKIGKVEPFEFDFDEITIKDAFNEIYFDEMAND